MADIPIRGPQRSATGAISSAHAEADERPPSAPADIDAAELVGLYLRPGTLHLPALPPLSLYVHLPWCLQKCPYCDFNSHEWRGSGEAPFARYLDALRTDLEAALPLVWGRRVHSVFIGGGTPSLFSPDLIGQLVTDIRARLPLEPGCEITLEANPGTFETDRFKGFHDGGITRLSIGVQSFDDASLKALGRVHDSAQAVASIEEAARVFDTFNIDLMYALPGQTLPAFERDLERALSFQSPHLSVYHLTIEPNTRFAMAPPVIPDDDTAFDMLDLITERTGRLGLERYEVSAYARPGHRCVHNLNYWQFGDYLGVGAGAHSKLSFPHRVVRQVRWREPNTYMDKALQGRALSNSDEVARAQLPFEFMLNALRLREGFALQLFSDRTGLSIAAINVALAEAERKGLIDMDLHTLRPTERGFDFLNDLQSLFLA